MYYIVVYQQVLLLALPLPVPLQLRKLRLLLCVLRPVLLSAATPISRLSGDAA